MLRTFVKLNKFQLFCIITCRDILYFVFWVPYCHNLWRHQFLICIIQKSWISLEWDEIWQKGKHHSSSLLKAFQIHLFFNTSIFHFIGTLKDIMGYRPPAYSPAIRWGQHTENIAIKEFFNCKRSQHKNMKIHKCGVVLWNTNPIIAASPDALLICSCCGVRPLELKGPFTDRDISISQSTKFMSSYLHPLGK